MPSRDSLILALDTSTARTSVALMHKGGALLSDLGAPPEKTHSRNLLGLVSAALDKANASFDSVSCLVVTVGPGSFTGLRIGLGTALGLGDSASVPVYGVDSLDAMVRSHQEGKHPYRLALLKSRRGEVYTALYERVEDSYQKIGDDQVVPNEGVDNLIVGKTLLLSDGSVTAEESLIGEQTDHSLTWATALSREVAVGAALIACEKIADGSVDTLSTRPKYVGRPQAEIQWEQTHLAS